MANQERIVTAQPVSLEHIKMIILHNRQYFRNNGINIDDTLSESDSIHGPDIENQTQLDEQTIQTMAEVETMLTNNITLEDIRRSKSCLCEKLCCCCLVRCNVDRCCCLSSFFPFVALAVFLLCIVILQGLNL